MKTILENFLFSVNYSLFFFSFKMENIDSYEDAKYFYKKIFAPERQKMINDLTSLRDEIQQEGSMQKSKAVTYSRAGIVGGVLVLGGY